MHVDPPLVEPKRIATRTVVPEPDLLVDVSSAGVERVNLEVYPMEAKSLKPVADDQLGRFGSETAATTAGADEGTKAARAVRLVPVIKHNFPDHRPALTVDDGEDESVFCGAPASIRRTQIIHTPGKLRLVTGVDRAREYCGFWVLEQAVHDVGVVRLDVSQADEPALEVWLVSEDRGHSASLPVMNPRSDSLLSFPNAR